MENKEQNTPTPKAGKNIPLPLSTGTVTLLGAGIYDLEGIFLDPAITQSGPELKRVHLHSTNFGDVFDASGSEVLGNFYLNPSQYVGLCRYSLEEVDMYGGEMLLTIKTKDGLITIAEFTGPSEGFGEAFVTDRKGHLHVEPSEHENKVNFYGYKDITSIRFELEDYIVTQNASFDGIHWNVVNNNSLLIDVKAERIGSKSCADFYKDFVGEDNVYNMMHSRGGDVKPHELNFAFTGTLYIDDKSYQVCIGQGHHETEYNWHLSSPSLESNNDHKKGILGKEFEITTKDSENFYIAKI